VTSSAASTSSAGGSPARTSATQDAVLDWLANGRVSGGSTTDSSPKSGRSGASSRTSLVSCHQEDDGTWVPSSGRWGTWGMGSPTECWTLSGSEFPSGAVACSLSDILETGEHLLRYSLSQKACAGILRRAEKRGRRLPPSLAAALERVAQTTTRPRPDTSFGFHLTQTPIHVEDGTPALSPGRGDAPRSALSLPVRQHTGRPPDDAARRLVRREPAAEVVTAPVTPALSTGGGKPGMGYPADPLRLDGPPPHPARV
jgi:hypothetical protein